jgi:hypothetical protein
MEGRTIRIDSAGTFSVRSISAIGCISNPSTPVIVQQLTDSVPPRPILEIVGDTALCTGERTQLFAPEGYSRYHWERTDDNYGSFTSTDNFMEVSFTSSYSVSLENEVGCLSAPSDTVSIAAYRTPGQPVVQVNNNLLACSISGDSYR